MCWVPVGAKRPLLPTILISTLLFGCAPFERAAGDAPPVAVAGGWPAAEVASLSPGCGSTDVPEAPDSVFVNGVSREVLTRLPESYRADTAHDLVVAFHGRTSPSSEVRGYFDLDEALPQAIIVYPSALPFSSGFRWSDPGDPPAELRDFELFDRLLEVFSDDFCLDLDRVFVVGHSLGASFANNVACHRGTVVRAVASVAGGIGGGTCDGGAAAMLIHHPDDKLVPIALGLLARDRLMVANGLAGQPVHASEPELLALGCRRFGPESPDPVIWCEHDDATTYGGRYYPHNWPDAAAPAIARFFRDLPW